MGCMTAFSIYEVLFALEYPEIFISHTLLHKPESKISKQISRHNLELLWL